MNSKSNHDESLILHAHRNSIDLIHCDLMTTYGSAVVLVLFFVARRRQAITWASVHLKAIHQWGPKIIVCMARWKIIRGITASSSRGLWVNNLLTTGNKLPQEMMMLLGASLAVMWFPSWLCNEAIILKIDRKGWTPHAVSTNFMFLKSNAYRQLTLFAF